MRINCPYCGDRDVGEFTYYGDAAPARPNGTGPEAMPAWHDYVYRRTNPAGRHRELWYHVAGCRAWLEMTRDTRTHEIFGVKTAGDPGRSAPSDAAP